MSTYDNPAATITYILYTDKKEEERERVSPLPSSSRPHTPATSLPTGFPSPASLRAAILEALVCEIGAADQQGFCDWDKMGFGLIGEDGAGGPFALAWDGFLGGAGASAFELALLLDDLAQFGVVGCDLRAEECGRGVCGLEGFHYGGAGCVWNVGDSGWVDGCDFGIEACGGFGEEGDDVEGFAVWNGGGVRWRNTVHINFFS